MERIEFLSELISGPITKAERTLWPLPNIASLAQFEDYSASGIVFLHHDTAMLARKGYVRIWMNLLVYKLT